MKLSDHLAFVEIHKPEDFDANASKYDICKYLGRLYQERLGSEIDGQLLGEKLIEREKLITTGVGHGIAFPHAKIKGIQRVSIGIYKFHYGFDWESMDGKKVDLAISVIGVDDRIGTHLNTMARLSYIFKTEKNREKLREILNPSLAAIDINAVKSILDSAPI